MNCFMFSFKRNIVLCVGVNKLITYDVVKQLKLILCVTNNLIFVDKNHDSNTFLEIQITNYKLNHVSLHLENL